MDIAELNSYRPMMVRVAAKILNNHDSAEDAAQEALLLALQHIEAFKGGEEKSLPAWLRQIAANAALDIIRKRQRRPEHQLVLREDGDQYVPRSMHYTPQPERYMDEARHVSHIYHQIDRIQNDFHRRVMTLRVVYGLEWTQVAELLGSNQTTVKIIWVRWSRMLVRKVIHAEQSAAMAARARGERRQAEGVGPAD